MNIKEWLMDNLSPHEVEKAAEHFLLLCGSYGDAIQRGLDGWEFDLYAFGSACATIVQEIHRDSDPQAYDEASHGC